MRAVRAMRAMRSRRDEGDEDDDEGDGRQLGGFDDGGQPACLSVVSGTFRTAFPSPHHDGGTNFSPTLQSWGSAICAGPQANRKPVHLSFIFPNLLPLADIGEAQHRVKTSNLNDDHFLPLTG